MTASTRYRISPDKFKDCPDLEQPLMHVVLSMQQDIARLAGDITRMHVTMPMDLVVTANTPGSAPWPLRLSQVTASPIGATIMRIENITTPGASGVPTSAVAITAQRVESNTVFIDFIAGLTVGQKYRLVFGVYDAS